ncbi:hypothetical protein A2Y83_00360 [Candidatus Falkowbacteria bacterium RBG_13_39_14]|uniref:Glycosyl transferase family 1 domain-containing protein n=1 Tax=Candidatus Falkowbacteria bacterium RBG_13_39_14 TaxID=1797985 RepID=A0A1F5S7F2_9BACT|nr:MAG: hypothetical protein A2Y83_00360 [Candidatus Falkowbacteria bacterium RBG_13_39_14]
MRIGVDIRSLMDQEYSGVNMYAFNLLDALFRVDSINEYILFYNNFSKVKVLDRFNFAPRIKRGLQRGSDAERGYCNVSVLGSRIPNKIFNASVTFLGRPKIDKLAAEGANRRGFFDEIGRSVEKSPACACLRRQAGRPPAPLYKRGESKKIDLFFSPNLLFSAFSKDCKKVLTVHDLSFERCPQFYSLKGRLWHKLVRCRKMCESSDMIVAVSENTKYDIMELYGIPEEKIRVVYPGFGNVRGCEGVNWTNRTDKTYHLPQRYILFVGNVEARKNVGGIIEAFRILNEEYGISDYDLVIAGKVRNKEIKKLRNLGMTEEVKNKIKLIGYADEEMKVYLYRNADLFVYPSFYEGFGFPPLEAMSCGVPVVTSDSSSLPEVVGDAGIKVDPHNIRDIARAMAEILRDKDLRDLLVKKGYERIKKFSWEKSARKVLEIFNELGEN